MKHLTAIFGLCASLSLVSVPVMAEVTHQAAAVPSTDSQTAGFSFSQAWSNAMPAVAKTGAVYFSIANDSGQDDQLLTVAAPTIAEVAELHGHSHQGDVMQMFKHELLEIAAGERLELTPNADHIMLLDLKQPLVAGLEFPLELTFAKAGAVTLMVKVKAQEL